MATVPNRALNISETTPSVYLDLESSLDLQKVRDIVSFQDANQDKLIILDEVQRLPEVFSPLRGIIDKEHVKATKLGNSCFSDQHPLNYLSNRANHWLVGSLILSYLVLTN